MLWQVLVRPSLFSGYYGTDKTLISRIFQPLMATVTFTGIAVQDWGDVDQALTCLATNDWSKHV